MTLDPFRRWPEIDEIFGEALDLPPERRHAYLEQRCEDPDLLREVQALLDDEVLSRTLFSEGASSPWFEESDDTPPGGIPGEQDVIGAYRLVRALGKGGSSTVYLAERVDGSFRQRVAVKILDPVLMGRTARERFNQERQILADLHHPNIAQLLDGGVTAAGWPYIVMEYVAGVPIDRYCDENRLTLKQRLTLVHTVCEAVHHAHTALVVHRDLKPSNVLVTTDGEVRLLDFGIAKILGERESRDVALDTRTGVRPMTPAYAAPEQITGEPVTTATDVYQLGALLFHLLTGRRPFGTDTALAALRERVDREGPEPPSRVVTSTDRAGTDPAPGHGSSTAESVAWRRRTSLSGLRSQLRGELDTLILTAMKRAQGRRYSSVEALGADIQRYLDGHPLRAHPDSIAYRTSKFLGRHPAGTSLSLMAVLALTALSVGLVRQTARADRERDSAEEVASFLVGLFERPDPQSATTDTLTARALLDEGATRVRESLEGEPLLQASVMSAVARAYRGLGQIDQAYDLMSSAMEIQQDRLDADDPALGATLHEMGEILIEKREFAEAERRLREALSVWQHTRGDDSWEAARELGSIGLAMHAQGKYDEARALYEDALRIYRRRDTPLDQTATETLVNLGWLDSAQGRLTEAEALFREALILRRTQHGENHASVASALAALAETEHNAGQLDSASVHAAAAVRVMEDLFGDRNVRVVGPLLTLAGIHRAAGRTDQAEEEYRRALAVTLETLGPETPDAARIRSDLGGLLRDEGELDEAESMGRWAVATYTALLGPDHLLLAFAHHNLGSTLAARGRWEEAGAHLQEAVRVFTVNRLDADPRVAPSLTELGRVKVAQGRASEAEPLLTRALGILEENSSADTLQLAGARALLGRSLALQGRLGEAEPLLRGAHASLLARGTGDGPSASEVAGWLAELYEALGRDAEAARFRSLAGG